MNSKKKKQLQIIPIGLAICLMGIITFLFLHFFTSDATSGPDDYDNGTPGIENPGNNETPDGNTAAGLDTPDPNYGTYDLIQMSESDIGLGDLILVDGNNRYNIRTEDLDLVYIKDEKNAPYIVRFNDYRLLRRVIDPLDEMMQAFIDDNDENSITIYSAYRDEAAQQSILDNFISTIGREEAMRRAALPGHSEHHTGLAVDLSVLIDGIDYSFDYRRFNFHEPTKWYFENAHKFGFILSFPEDRTEDTGTIYEPWHYRYVGLPHSLITYTNNFLLKEYLDYIRQYSFENPLVYVLTVVELDSAETTYRYEVYFTSGTDVKVPLNVEYDISGNNIDGFIVTIKK